MKYILICIATLLICVGLGAGMAYILKKCLKKPMPSAKIALLGFAAVVLLLIAVMLVYFGIYYHAEETAQKAMNGTDTVRVEAVRSGTWFDGAGEDTALIFYAGAKVEEEAYAPFMTALAENGIDCFLADMPLHFAIFGGNIADSFISAYSYDTWLMAGHSMGGLMAANYACGHPDTVDGVVLLAAYSTHPLDGSLKLISVYGSEDGCLNRQEYEKDKQNWPENALECVIDGGNHAGFGMYGFQRGDGKALISADEQQKQTVQAILEGLR